MSGYNKAELNLDGKTFPLNLITGTDGKQGIDIKDLYDSTGVVTVDPGAILTKDNSVIVAIKLLT